MSNDQTADLAAVVEDLRNRVRYLEDIEALRNLKAKYAAACDDNYDPDRLAALFVEDATWESQGMGRYEGREAIREFFRGISGHFVFALHYGLNPQIEVAKDRIPAIRRWLGGTCSCRAPWETPARLCGGPVSTKRNTCESKANGCTKARSRPRSSTRPSRRVGQSSSSSSETRFVPSWYDEPESDRHRNLKRRRVRPAATKPPSRYRALIWADLRYSIPRVLCQSSFGSI